MLSNSFVPRAFGPKVKIPTSGKGGQKWGTPRTRFDPNEHEIILDPRDAAALNYCAWEDEEFDRIVRPEGAVCTERKQIPPCSLRSRVGMTKLLRVDRYARVSE